MVLDAYNIKHYTSLVSPTTRLPAHAVLSGGLDSLALQWDTDAGQVLARHSTGQSNCPYCCFMCRWGQCCLVLPLSNPY